MCTAALAGVVPLNATVEITFARASRRCHLFAGFRTVAKSSFRLRSTTG